MMLSEIIDPSAISLNIVAESKKDAFSKTLDIIKKKFTKIERQKIIKYLLEREQLGSTTCEKFVAIPHARLDFINYFVVLVGRFDQGLNFDSSDEYKTYLMFILLGPKDKPQEYLKYLANISKLLKDHNIKELLLNAKNPDEFHKIIVDFENEQS
jgi:nitrogen PTS system EIIA component